jgi:ferrochelatase
MLNNSSCGVLLIGFGGPEKRDDVLPFLRDVTAGRNIPEARLALVAKQYDAIGGVSPYTCLTAGQADALTRLLVARGLPVPVKAGYLHSAPRLGDVLEAFLREGRSDLSVIILAPHRSPASYDNYLLALDKATASCRVKNLPEPRIRLFPPWHNRPGFLQALADRVLQAAEKIGPIDWRNVELIYTAHSIPAAMAQASPYVQQLHETAKGVSVRIKAPYYHLAFQSRSGRPEDPWLEPDIGDFLEERSRAGLKNAVVAPISFLVDHVEVLYDLDVLARKRAETAEIRMVRAGTVGDHPSFIALLASLVEEAFGLSETETAP